MGRGLPAGPQLAKAHLARLRRCPAPVPPSPRAYPAGDRPATCQKAGYPGPLPHAGRGQPQRGFGTCTCPPSRVPLPAWQSTTQGPTKDFLATARCTPRLPRTGAGRFPGHWGSSCDRPHEPEEADGAGWGPGSGGSGGGGGSAPERGWESLAPRPPRTGGSTSWDRCGGREHGGEGGDGWGGRVTSPAGSRRPASSREEPRQGPCGLSGLSCEGRPAQGQEPSAAPARPAGAALAPRQGAQGAGTSGRRTSGGRRRTIGPRRRPAPSSWSSWLGRCRRGLGEGGCRRRLGGASVGTWAPSQPVFKGRRASGAARGGGLPGAPGLTGPSLRSSSCLGTGRAFSWRSSPPVTVCPRPAATRARDTGAGTRSSCPWGTARPEQGGHRPPQAVGPVGSPLCGSPPRAGLWGPPHPGACTPSPLVQDRRACVRRRTGVGVGARGGRPPGGGGHRSSGASSGSRVWRHGVSWAWQGGLGGHQSEARRRREGACAGALGRLGLKGRGFGRTWASVQLVAGGEEDRTATMQAPDDGEGGAGTPNGPGGCSGLGGWEGEGEEGAVAGAAPQVQGASLAPAPGAEASSPGATPGSPPLELYPLQGAREVGGGRRRSGRGFRGW